MEMKEEGNGDEKRRRVGREGKGGWGVGVRGNGAVLSRQNARRQKHTVPGRYQRFQDGCRRRLSSAGPTQSPAALSSATGDTRRPSPDSTQVLIRREKFKSLSKASMFTA